MKRSDRIRLNFTRNWNFPGKERLSHWFRPSEELKQGFEKGIIWLNTEDIAIYTTADNCIEWTILSSGTYEEEIGRLIKINLREGDVALDIGANIGLQSLRMAGRVGSNGKVYAFEPIAHLQEKFRNNISLNKADNIVLLPFALADKESEAEFKIDKNAWNQGTFSLNKPEAGSEMQKVIIKIADDIPEIQNLEKLALIKIDVEGFEFPVLKGLKKTLQKHKPRIIFEYDRNYCPDPDNYIEDCFSFLKDLNYDIYQINPVGCELVSSAEVIESGNLFCI